MTLSNPFPMSHSTENQEIPSPDGPESLEDASKLIAEAVAHERYSHYLQELTRLQLQRAHQEVKLAELQLVEAENYTSTVICIVQKHGFKVSFDKLDNLKVTDFIDDSGGSEYSFIVSGQLSYIFMHIRHYFGICQWGCGCRFSQ